MSAMTALITSACIGLSGAHQQACEKAIEAGSKQTGLEQSVDQIQKMVERKANNKAKDIIGKSGMDIAGGGIFLVKTAIDKSVKINLPTLGICDRISTQVGVNQNSMQMEWGF